jgi:hypothetical protein
MLIDALTKDMDLSHLHRVLEAGEWCAKFTTRFVKANKPVKAKAPTDEVMVGKTLHPEDPLLSRLMWLSERPGWHLKDNIVVHVARNAKTFRSCKPRYDPKEYSLRSSYGRFDKTDGTTEWRRLEHRVSFEDLPYSYGAMGETCDVLITFFQMPQTTSHDQKKKVSPEEAIACHG